MTEKAENVKNFGVVSIIMPAYNDAEYIAESIQSIQSQTYPFWELIIVDDCSSDKTYEIVQGFCSDGRIRLLKNVHNSGAALTRNYALREATGKWIAFLDADDVWLPEKLEKQLEFMVENDYKFTYTDYRIRLNGEWLPYINTGPSVVTKHKLYNYCFFSTITVIYDKEYVGLIQVADLKKNNDYAMWYKVIEKSPCYRFPYCLSYYYKHDNSVSSGSKFKLIRHYYILYRVGLEKGRFISGVLTLNNLFWGVYKRLFYKKKVEE